jgi:plastocyanin
VAQVPQRWVGGRRRQILALAGLLAVLALAAPPDRASAQSTWDVQARDDAGNYWAPDRVEAELSDTIRWRWDQAAIDHNVYIVPPGGTPELLSPALTPPGAPPVTYEPPAEGAYQFYCSLHGTSTAGMAGVALVGVEDGGGGPDPLPNPTGPPTELEHGDNDPPQLSKLRVEGLRRGARMRFVISEPGRATARFLRKRGGGQRRLAAKLRLRRLEAGTVSKRLRDRKLASGRYQVRVRAFDRAGNPSNRKSKTVKVEGG